MIEKKDGILADESLKKVNGGFYEEDVGVIPKDYHKTIKCPNCGNEDRSKIKYEKSGDILLPGDYHCLLCGKYFDAV